MKDELKVHHMTEWRKKIADKTEAEAEEEIREERIILKRRMLMAEEQLSNRKEELALIESFDIKKEMEYIAKEGIV